MNAKKVIRRKAALARFTILSLEQFNAQKKEGTYDAYVARKQAEQKSLTK